MIRRSSRANKGRHSQRDAEIEEAFKDEIENYISDDERPSKKLKIDNDDDGEYGEDEVDNDIEADFNGSDVDEEDLDPSNDSGSVKCICGANDSNYEDFNEKYGEDMICCDKCNTWQHNSCMKIKQVPKKYECNDCVKGHSVTKKVSNTKNETIATKPKITTKPKLTTKSTITKSNNNDFPEFKDKAKINIARIFQTTVIAKLPQDSDEGIAHNWAVRLTNAVYTDSNPQQKARAVLPLLKNNDVLNKMISNSITPEQLISLRPQDVVKGLNEIAEKVKLESLKRSVLKVDEAPRVRRTHKGDEVVEDVSDQHKTEMEINIVSRSVDHRVFEEKKVVKEEVKDKEVAKETNYNYNTAMLDDESEDETSFTKEKSAGLDDDDDMDKILGHKTPPATAPSTPAPKSILKSPSTKSILKNSSTNTNSTNTNVANTITTKIDSCEIWKGRLTFPDFTTFMASAKFLTATGYLNPTSESTIKFHNHCINTSKQILTRSFYDIQGKLDRSRADPYLTTVKSSKDFFVFEITNDDNQDDYNKLFSYLLNKNRVGVLSGKPSFAKDAYLFALKDSVPSYFRDLINLNGRQGLYAVYVLKKNDRPSVSAPVKASVEVANPLSSILSALSTPAAPTPVPAPQDKLAHLNLPGDLTPQQRTAIVNLLEANPHLEGNPEQILAIVRLSL